MTFLQGNCDVGVGADVVKCKGKKAMFVFSARLITPLA